MQTNETNMLRFNESPTNPAKKASESCQDIMENSDTPNAFSLYKQKIEYNASEFESLDQPRFSLLGNSNHKHVAE